MHADERGLERERSTIEAARAGDAAMLAALLDAGVEVEVRNENGDGLLMLASYHGHVEATRFLLERGADPNVLNARGQAPLAGAVFKGDRAMVELLLWRGRSERRGCRRAHAADVRGDVRPGRADRPAARARRGSPSGRRARHDRVRPGGGDGREGGGGASLRRD